MSNSSLAAASMLSDVEVMSCVSLDVWDELPMAVSAMLSACICNTKITVSVFAIVHETAISATKDNGTQ